MNLHPAPEDYGVVFRRTDLEPAAKSAHLPPQHMNSDIPALWDAVSDTIMSTTIQNEGGVKVATIEHLMAALFGMG